jgi:hypothetical protein
VAESRKRTATEIINNAINENRFGEHLRYLFSCVTFFVGIVVLGVGAYQGQPIIAASGTVAAALFYPAMRLARGIREQNMAIRLLEIPLTNSKTAEEATKILNEFFSSTIRSKSAPKKGLPKP